MIAENISAVQLKIKEACIRAGRNPEDCTLIAVSKTKPLPGLKEAYDAGKRDFGENKVQELQDKIPAMPADVKWHLIGHLQRNKVKYIVDKVYLIHSIDSYRLAEQVEKEAVKKNVDVNILIEVNVAEEESKFGLTVDNTIAEIEAIAKLPHVHIKGLMTIAPYTDDPETNRPYFKQLKALSDKIKEMNIPNVEMKELSMGMTGDYEVAVEEGATLVRVGTGIFGQRNYNI